MQITKSTLYQIIAFHVYIVVFYITIPFKDKWWATVLLLTIVFTLAVLEYMRTGYVVSPLLIWYVFWLGAISFGRMDLNLYPLYRVWEASLVKLILINTYIFFVSFWLGESLLKKKDGEILSGISEKSFSMLTEITIFLLVTAMLSFTVNAVRVGYIPMLTGEANTYRSGFIRAKYYKIVSALRFVFAVIPITIKNEKNTRKKALVIALAISLIIAEILSGWRTYAFQAMILYISSQFIVLGKAKSAAAKKYYFRIIIILIVLALAFVGVVAVTRESFAGSLREKIEYMIYTFYMYIAPNFINLQSAVENVEPLFAPIYSTKAIWGFFPNRDVIFFSVKEIDQAIGAFNVSTYLLHPWGDYGYIGTYIWSSFIAIVSGASFKKCRNNAGLFSAVILGIMNITIFLMHNNFFLRSSSTIMWIIAAACIKLITERKKEAVETIG